MRLVAQYEDEGWRRRARIHEMPDVMMRTRNLDTYILVPGCHMQISQHGLLTWWGACKSFSSCYLLGCLSKGKAILASAGKQKLQCQCARSKPNPFLLVAYGPVLLQLIGLWVCRRKQTPRRHSALLNHVW